MLNNLLLVFNFSSYLRSWW